ncbi:MAG: aspartate/glutamate racemase family protein, partial [Candidatus Bathyarchaeota archaeon]
MGYGYKLRIGLLAPSSNTSMEPDFYRMAPNGVSIHTARMRLDEVTQKGLIEMAEDAERASALLATAGVDLVVYGCTTGSLIGGVKWEKTLMNKIEKRTSIPAFSTSGAVVEALTLFGRRIGIATPYTEALNQLEREFLEAQGLEVGDMKGLGLTNNLEIGRTQMKTIQELVKSVIT